MNKEKLQQLAWVFSIAAASCTIAAVVVDYMAHRRG